MKDEYDFSKAPRGRFIGKMQLWSRRSIST
jgi:hypothetical protein